MERIVYLLGAGFSHPLGLPLMNDFYFKSKDMYYSDATKYPHFAAIFKWVDAMARSKNYYATDLHNIEEILSILEMEESIGVGSYRQAFVKYLSDVIER